MKVSGSKTLYGQGKKKKTRIFKISSLDPHKEESKSYRFDYVREWVNDDRVLILVNYPFNKSQFVPHFWHQIWSYVHFINEAPDSFHALLFLSPHLTPLFSCFSLFWLNALVCFLCLVHINVCVPSWGTPGLRHITAPCTHLVAFSFLCLIQTSICSNPAIFISFHHLHLCLSSLGLAERPQVKLTLVFHFHDHLLHSKGHFLLVPHSAIALHLSPGASGHPAKQSAFASFSFHYCCWRSSSFVVAFFSLIGLDPVLHTPSYPTAGRLQRFSKFLAVFDWRQTVSSGKHYGPALRCPNQLALDATRYSSPGRFPQMHLFLWTTFLHTSPILFTVSWRTRRSTFQNLMPSILSHPALCIGPGMMSFRYLALVGKSFHAKAPKARSTACWKETQKPTFFSHEH